MPTARSTGANTTSAYPLPSGAVLIRYVVGAKAKESSLVLFSWLLPTSFMKRQKELQKRVLTKVADAEE